MVPLVFGTSLCSDWNMVMLQMVYALIFDVLRARRGDDAFTVGALFGSVPSPKFVVHRRMPMNFGGGTLPPCG